MLPTFCLRHPPSLQGKVVGRLGPEEAPEELSRQLDVLQVGLHPCPSMQDGCKARVMLESKLEGLPRRHCLPRIFEDGPLQQKEVGVFRVHTQPLADQSLCLPEEALPPLLLGPPVQRGKAAATRYAVGVPGRLGHGGPKQAASRVLLACPKLLHPPAAQDNHQVWAATKALPLLGVLAPESLYGRTIEYACHPCTLGPSHHLVCHLLQVGPLRPRFAIVAAA
mmetsp:Transcript_5514/g.15368  ORF Transcript_5514/g.15368 Transcript_5514/m.15368 type:complete len:223 (+) Transcript_5514:1005-1673(+)